jgi:hypothetical protein
MWRIVNIALQSQYIDLLLQFVINNRRHFEIKSEINNINTRNILYLHYAQSLLSVCQEGAHYGI